MIKNTITANEKAGMYIRFILIYIPGKSQKIAY